MNEYNWKIEHDCPQCGAPVTLDEADRILLCPYCRTKLYLSAEDHFRYYIPPPGPTSQDTIYIPYWRIKGLSYNVQGYSVSNRFVDTSMLAINLGGTPYSLGLRPQVFKLKFISPETEGKFLEPSSPVQETIKTTAILISNVPEQTAAFSGLTTPLSTSFYNAFIGETVSMIYSPMYVENNILYDSLLKRPACELKTSDIDRLLNSSTQHNWQIAFISTLCPQCGWNLEGEKDAVVMTCKNCDSAWNCKGKGFEKIKFDVMAVTENVSQYLPFWRMKARIEGIKLDSYADLIRAGNLPKAITDSFENLPIYFWCPAFKINPVVFLRWARQMTISQPEGKSDSSFPRMPVYPVTLPMSEAVESIIITIADIVTDKRRVFPLLPQIRITLDECLLVYHPFIDSHNELIHSTMHFSFDKKSLAYGTNL
ncbi:MAG TPA: hypothetical protein VEF33_02750 [Syntrophales bacterium]|nr:hypothetical protein [Syntrophales bacterium]